MQFNKRWLAYRPAFFQKAHQTPVLQLNSRHELRNGIIS